MKKADLDACFLVGQELDKAYQIFDDPVLKQAGDTISILLKVIEDQEKELKQSIKIDRVWNVARGTQSIKPTAKQLLTLVAKIAKDADESILIDQIQMRLYGPWMKEKNKDKLLNAIGWAFNDWWHAND